MMFSLRVCPCQAFFWEVYLNSIAPLLCVWTKLTMPNTDGTEQTHWDGPYRRSHTLSELTPEVMWGWGGALWGHQKKSAMWFLFPYTLSKLKASHWIWRLTGFCKIHVLAYFHHIVKVGLDEKKLIQMWNCSSLIAVTIFMCINISNNICWIFILYLYITARAAI